MSHYQIKQYSWDRAKELNVQIKPSANPKKKSYVFDKNDKFIVSVGANGYSDYPTHLQQGDKALADKREQLYKARHKTDRKVVGSAAYYADQIVW